MSKYTSRKKTEFLLSEEAATDQVVELLDYYNIDVDRLTAGETKDDKASAAALEKALDHVRDAFRSGQLEVSRDAGGKLLVTQHITGGTTLVYVEVGAKHKLAMEKFDPAAGYSRIYAFMGALCGVGKTGIEKLPVRDLSVVEVLGSVFSNA